MDKHDRVSIIYFSFLLIPTFLIIILLVSTKTKLGCVVRMVIDSILPHAESGPNDQRKDVPRFNYLSSADGSLDLDLKLV